MPTLLESWEKVLPVLYNFVGEPVTWHQSGVNTAVTAIVDRRTRGDTAADDGIEVDQSDGMVTVRRADLAADPVEGAAVTVAIRKGGASTEVYAVGRMVKDYDNGSVAFDIWRGDGRRFQRKEHDRE